MSDSAASGVGVPHRSNTAQSSYISMDNKSRNRVKKRIVVCCDGTWQDGLTVKDRWMYTNILKLARTVEHHDDRFDPPIPQVVFYQSGIGSEDNVFSELQGTTGATLADKVQEAYGFIAHNFQPGDEIFLFGFSRGAYTARMVAMFVGAIGVLDRTDMDHFAGVFMAFQKRGKAKDNDEIAKLDKELAPWVHHDSPGKKRADSDKDSFSVKCVGVFDTVGSLGLPDEIKVHSEKVTQIFGFPDTLLGEHVESAFHALALNETRKDFNCTKFQQTEGGKAKGQVLKQCWFAGSHSDIGGGWHDHDLSDLTLMWMLSNVEHMLAIDFSYLQKLPDPVAPWGEQPPHDPRTGVFELTTTIQRQIPTSPNPVTNETVHPSVFKQKKVLPVLQETITKYPELVSPLLPLEEGIKANWPYVPGKNPPKDVAEEKTGDKTGAQGKGKGSSSLLDTVVKKGSALGQEALFRVTHTRTMSTEGGEPVYAENDAATLMHESHVGPYLREVLGNLQKE